MLKSYCAAISFLLLFGFYVSAQESLPELMRKARTHSKANEKDQALTILSRVVERGFRNVQLLRTDPDFASLQGDTRFDSILQKAQRNLTPCKFSDDFRAFDFWVGEWNVEVNGRKAGTNSVQIILDDCVILEQWTATDGYTGKSINTYNPAIKKWHQVWVDNSGSILFFTGEYKDGKMEFIGETPQSDGTIMKERLTFYKLPERKLRQHWEQSADGNTWTTVFDGLYSPSTQQTQ